MSETTKLIANRIFAILTGVVAGAIVIGLLETVNNGMYPIPEGLDFQDKTALGNHIKGLPMSAFIFILLAHASGALVGGFVASKMAKVQKKGAAMFTGLILLLAGVLNLISIPHPMWFSITDVIIYTPLAIAGNWVRSQIWP